jgi:hypothetical protein
MKHLTADIHVLEKLTWKWVTMFTYISGGLNRPAKGCNWNFLVTVT